MPERTIDKSRVQALLNQTMPGATFNLESKTPISDAMRPRMVFSTNESGSPVDQFGNPITGKEKTGFEYVDEVLMNPAVVKVRPYGAAGSEIFYSDGTSKKLSREQGGAYLSYYSPDLVGTKTVADELDEFTFADGTVVRAQNPVAEQTSGNFFESGNWGPYLIGAALAAYGGAAAGAAYSGLAGEAAAAAGGTAGSTAAGAGTGLGMEAGMEAAGYATQLGGLTAGQAAAGGATAAATEAAIAPAVTQAAASAGVSLTPAEAAAAAAKVAAAKAAAAGGTTWTAQNILAAASLAITAGSTIAAIADGGDKATSATTTTTPTGPGTNKMPGGGAVMPGGTTTGTGTGTTGTGTSLTPGGVNTLNPDGTPKTAGALTFEDFINDFYGLNAQTKSVQARGEEDQAALKGYQQTLLDALKTLDATRLTDTTAAMKPYQDKLTDIGSQLSGNTGLGKQVAFGYGGKQMASFVPKTNKDLANQILDISRTRASTDTGLIDMGYNSGRDLAGREFGFNSENLPNKAADTYSAKLSELMKYLNPNTGQTSTTTGTVPGTPWYTTALQGLNAGVNLWDKIYNPRASSVTALTPEQKAALGIT